MFQINGDLVPSVSGRANLGVNVSPNGSDAFDITTLRPFNHVHMNSGVWHDQSGESGVLRYSRAANAFELSTDGGNIFRPIIVALQGAYDGGDEVNLDYRNGYKGILLKETIPGVAQLDANDNILRRTQDYAIAVSGFTLDPLNPHRFSFAGLRSNALVISGSGNPTESPTSLFLGFANPPGFNNSAIFSTSGNMFLNAGGFITVFSDGDMNIIAGNVAGDADMIIGATDNIIIIPTGDGTFNSSKQTLLVAFASGFLNYQFGPHQSWYIKTSHALTGGPFNNGFWPIPHSGMILEMIARTPKSKAITIERPAVNNDLTIWYTNEAIFITEVESVLRGGFDASGEFAIRHSTDRSQVGTSITTLPIVCTNRTTGQITTSFVSQSIPADSWLWIGVSGVSGIATSQLNVTIQYLN